MFTGDDGLETEKLARTTGGAQEEREGGGLGDVVSVEDAEDEVHNEGDGVQWGRLVVKKKYKKEKTIVRVKIKKYKLKED